MIWAAWAMVVGATAAVAARAIVRSETRATWSLIALGLAAWAVGDAIYNVAGTSPSAADALYYLSYAAFVGGMRMLRGRPPFSLALLVVLLGLATLWSWLVFGDVVAGAEGSTAAVATAIGYPLLDLVLIVSALLLVASRGWRVDTASCALAAGFALMACADLVYVVQLADGGYEETVLSELPWAAGAALIAVSAWTARRPDPDHERGDRVVEALTTAAILTACGILFVDHFTRADTVTVVLAGLTLLAALAHRAGLHRERAAAIASAEAAEHLRVASAEAALDCIVSIDGEGTVVEWNDAAATTFGYPREVALGAPLADLIIPAESRPQHRAGLARVAQTGEGRVLNSQIEVMAVRASGETFPVELMITQVRADPPLFTGFLRDISDRRRREEENERLAAVVRSAENAVISKDLDDTVTAWNTGAERLYGYTAQEAIGRPLADLIIPPSHAHETEEATASVLDGEWATFETKRQSKAGDVLDVSVRAFAVRDTGGEVVGVCTSAHDITERLRREERERRDREGRLWRGRVRTALDEGHLMFWGQPVVDAVSGAIHHHELLLRMDLNGDVITPNHFLPHAEGCELITEIDRFAIKTGFEIAASRPVAINLSAQGLQDPWLINDIRNALGGSRERAKSVTFEITETAAVQNLDAARQLVQELTALGFDVALDDFGTGYGSFTYLKHLPVTELKIDIDFVRGLAKDPTAERLVKSIVSVARTFEMTTVAEGVEDQATLDVLRRLGVDLVQGYFTGYPAQMTGRGSALARLEHH